MKAEMMKKITSVRVLLYACAFLGGVVQAENIVRNSSFERGETFNGSSMREDDMERFQYHYRQNGQRVWDVLSAAAWWAQGEHARGLKIDESVAHSGHRSLLIHGDQKPFPVISAYERGVPAGDVTLSAWVKCEEAAGTMSLLFAQGQNQNAVIVSQKAVSLPANCGWQRISVTLHTDKRMQAIARFEATKGNAWVDDVQIESSKEPTEFHITPQEQQLVLSVAGTKDSDLPIWVAKDTAVRKLGIKNLGFNSPDTQITVFMGPWNHPHKEKIASFPASELSAGTVKEIDFSTAKLSPDAYVITLVGKQNGKTVLDSVKDFHPKRLVGGTVSQGMLTSTALCRFAIAPDIKPEDIFGVGNGNLLANCNWYGGHSIDELLAGKEVGFISTRGGEHSGDVQYIVAAGGMQTEGQADGFDETYRDRYLNISNPAANGRCIDIFNPKGWELIGQRGRQIGKKLANNPTVAAYQLCNEKRFFNDSMFCPTQCADEDFRNWCKKRFKTLDVLNKAWGTKYSNWNQVEQIWSARFAEEEKKRRVKKGAAAIDWTASLGEISRSGPILKRMREKPGQTMDWLRWRTERSLDVFKHFVDNAKLHDKKTLYSINLPWPNLFTQMFMPFIRDMDVTMLDVQYASGFKRALGNSYEMIEILEMSESVDPDKPIWGIEIYVQPVFPPKYAAMQNWGLVAHGMRNILIFGWKPYSDYGAIEGTKAWEKSDAKPIWCLIDNDGTKLPHYKWTQKSVDEINAFHKKYDGLSLKRVKTDIAYYISPDTGEYIAYQTGARSWEAKWMQARDTLIYMLRMNGITMDCVDNVTVPDQAGKYRTIILPPTICLSQNDAEKIAKFAKSGGKVILVGPCGLVDPWLKPYYTVGGPAWGDLHWKTKPSQVKKVVYKFENPVYDKLMPISPAKSSPIKDKSGNVIGWTRKWGKGELVAYKKLPALYSGNPHPPVELETWCRNLIRYNHLENKGRYVNPKPYSDKGKVGTGQPVVEIVVREKSPSEKFVFCMNQGGNGKGILEIPVGQKQYDVCDVITGKQITSGEIKNGIYMLPLKMKAWEYRVFRMTIK